MNKKVNIYVIKLNMRFIIVFSMIFLLILSIVFFEGFKIIDIFNLKNKITKTVVIDPGHGGIDGGANDTEGFLEKNMNLDIGLKLKTELEKDGYNVVMTREKDKSLEDLSSINASRYRRDLDARRCIIERANPMVFVSLHVNSNIKSREARGIQIYYYPTSENGRKLAEIIGYSINENIYRDFLEIDSRKTEILPQDYFILRETTHTGVLIETGFMTNPKDKALFENDEYKKRLAFSIKEGIINYIEDSRK